MSIKPILFNTDMVRAILDGRKTVTRRTVKLEKVFSGDAEKVYPGKCALGVGLFSEFDNMRVSKKPPYQPGDILWVQETWSVARSYLSIFGFDVEYKADGLIKPCILSSERYLKFEKYEEKNGWNSSYFMPKEAARIWLKVTNVRVERLQDMSHDAAGEEGIHYCECPDGFTWKTDADMKCCYLTPSGAFKALWNSTVNKEDIASYGWEANPWVWVIEFERCEKPQEDNK